MTARLLLILLLALPASARTLHWRAFDVEAHLDRDGNLQVRERHVMVFDGDWNGGARIFNSRERQTVEVKGVSRIDGTQEIPLTRGDLNQVDHWDFAGKGHVRWRSRLPEDPPFQQRELTYLLEVTYTNVLTPRRDPKRFELAHDFGMPQREGIIERFSLKLTFDPVWDNAAPYTVERTNVPPGEGMGVREQLVYRGATDPAGIIRPIAWWIPLSALAIFGIGAALIVLRFFVEERAHGRFAPIVPRFDESLTKLPAEVAGAIWDAGIGSPEVAAVLARMTQEGKLVSRVRDGAMHLSLKVDRDDLLGYERQLVTKLFFDGRDQTNTDAVRAHYAKSGFDPAGVIRTGIEEKLAHLVDWDQKVTRFSSTLNVVQVVGALLLVAGAILIGGRPDVVAGLVVVLTSGFFTIVAGLAASYYSRSIANVATGIVVTGIVTMVVCAPFVFLCIFSLRLDVHLWTYFALALWTLALVDLIFDVLRIQDPQLLIAFRKRIAGARQFFLDELRQGEPRLRDEWFPYILAFGLGSHVDRWFRSFGASGTHGATSSSTSFSPSSSTSSPTSGWTGGGGAFGGAGASGSWALAAGTMASGFSAPSSGGSSGGGGGGGSSSGGGGGGGW